MKIYKINIIKKEIKTMILNRDRHKFHLKDPISFLTHFIAFILSIFLMPVLLIHMSVLDAKPKTMVGLSIFMLSMILLYGASSAYHAFDISKYINKMLKKIDHMMIFVLIAGSYTPVCINALPNESGRRILILIWALAIIGMVIKYFWVTCPKWFSSVIYISMGWACIIVLPQIIKSFSNAGFIWLLIGGIVYTIGGVIYALKFKKLNKISKYFGSHEIFHIFVMVGSLCHYIVMYNYLPV